MFSITDSQGLDNTWFFDHVTDSFTEGPKLNSGRTGHSAGAIIDSTTNEQIIVVNGGRKDVMNMLNSTEILRGNSWVQGNCFI